MVPKGMKVSGAAIELNKPRVHRIHEPSVMCDNRSCVPESLLFHVAYLGTDQVSLQLNFSKNANMVAAQ